MNTLSVITQGRFAYSRQAFEALARRLAPCRGQATARTAESIQNMIDKPDCPAGVPYVTDQGAIYIRWIGARADDHYLASLGCDHERHAARNRDLLDIVAAFPVPER